MLEPDHQPKPKESRPCRPPRCRLEHLISWAMKGGPAPVGLTEASVERITLASEYLRMAGRSGAVYGLTTGVGALRTVPTDITPSDGTSHALRLWRSHATGFGDTYDDATARAGMAIRLHQITSGRRGSARVSRRPWARPSRRARCPTCTASARSAPATWCRSPSSA